MFLSKKGDLAAKLNRNRSIEKGIKLKNKLEDKSFSVSNNINII